MSIRFVTQKAHAYLDYPVALNLMLTPFLLKLGEFNPPALWLSVATGVAALTLTFFTDHETGIVRLLPYRIHLMVDRAVGFVFVLAPFVLGLSGRNQLFYLVNGVAVLLVTFVLNAQSTGDADPQLTAA